MPNILLAVLAALKPVMYVSRQKSHLEAAKVLPRPRLNVFMPPLGVDVMASALPQSHLFCLASTQGIE